MHAQEGKMQENVRFQLMVRRGPQPNQSYEITQELTTLGRDITNDIVINDRETSRHHLRLLRSGDSLTLEDLGSTNGTFVNGKRVSGVTPLQHGDMIGLGETVTLGLDIKRPPQHAPVTPPSASDELDTPPPAESASAAAPVQDCGMFCLFCAGFCLLRYCWTGLDRYPQPLVRSAACHAGCDGNGVLRLTSL